MALAKGVAGIVGVTIFAGTAYTTAVVFAPAETYQVSNEAREVTWEKLAPTYDKDTKSQEFYLGIGRMRRRILQEAAGKTLEVGAGTAVNAGLYPDKTVSEVIFTDRAGRMVDEQVMNIEARVGQRPVSYAGLKSVSESDDTISKSLKTLEAGGSSEHAAGCGCGSAAPNQPLPRREEQMPRQSLSKDEVREKEAKLLSTVNKLPKRKFPTPACETFEETVAKNLDISNLVAKKQLAAKKESIAQDGDGIVPVRYGVCQSTAEQLPFPDNHFDTVVDMFGLCAYNDPVEAVKEMSRVCKPNGKILMLEHGKGTWKTVNNYLNKWAPRHARSWGCWWNRDIKRFIRLSGAKVVSVETKHFGTTQYYILEPAKTLEEMEKERTLSRLRQFEYDEAHGGGVSGVPEPTVKRQKA